MADLLVRFVGDTSQLTGATGKANAALGGMQTQATGLRGKLQGVTGGLKALAVQSGATALAMGPIALAAVAIGGTAKFLKGAVTAASDLNENMNKTAVIFGEASASVIAFGEQAFNIGLSKNEAIGAAAAYGNMFNTLGLASDESAGMSIRMVELAADMASFNNEDPSDMLDRIRSGLAGEAEPLRQFGVLLSEAAVKEKAVEMGLVGVGQELTEAQKVQARYALILEQTTAQQGDFARTSDSLANQQRELNARFSDLSANIGLVLLPVVTGMVGALLAAGDAVAGLGNTIGGAIGRVQGLADAIGNIAGALARIGGMAALQGIAGMVIPGGGVIAGAANILGRQHGGPVSPGQAFLVGESGPELFVPGSAGTIVPGGMGANITINVAGSVLTEDQLIDRVRSGLLRRGLTLTSLGFN
ncbi:MAG: hypothetical protein GEU81_15330 [Nitriliruptorales bacterium]|nr:hypothetical protein [Nitriliruptorales bacterium]